MRDLLVLATSLLCLLSAAGDEKVFPEHRHLALSAEHARIVREGDVKAAERVREFPLSLPDEIALPQSWTEASNIVPCEDRVKALLPYVAKMGGNIVIKKMKRK